MCTKGRDVINASWWLAFTRNSSLKINNYKSLSQSRRSFIRLPDLLRPGLTLAESFSVARVRPRTSKGITDLLLLNLVRLEAACPSKKLYLQPTLRISWLFSRLESRSLSELTRQIAPPTKNGHAPPPSKSRKIFNLSILTESGPGKFPRVESN